MITLEEAKQLDCGTTIYSVLYHNADGTAQRFKVNGRPKTWKTRPDEVWVPLKRGLHEYGYLNEGNLDEFSLRKPVFITHNQIDDLFDSATHQADYLIGLYRLVYSPYWDEIKKVNGWPEIDDDTNNYIWRKAIEFDQVHHPDCVAGGAWMNNGFSTLKTLPKGTIIPAPVTYK